jgi:hypothetical protein
VTANPRPYGRQPVALRGLAESIERQIERELRAAAVQDDSVFAKAFWLRAESYGVGSPDYTHSYVYVAPILMSDRLCEVIETIVARIDGVTQTGRGGDRDKNLRPFVYAVVDLKARR